MQSRGLTAPSKDGCATRLAARTQTSARQRTVTKARAAPTQQPALKGPATSDSNSVNSSRSHASSVFPSDYNAAIRQAQEATKAAIADGVKLMEVEFPSSSITSAQGEGEGQNEMNANMGYLRQYMNAFRDNAANVRVFFPDNIEVAVARSGQTEDPAAGRIAMDPKFGEDNKFKLGYLTRQTASSAMWAMFGVNMDKFKASELVKDTDEMFVVAYPSFNPREELTASMQLYKDCSEKQERPLVIFNGELDRLRGGYYPGIFFPELAKVTSEFLPLVEGVYYIRNIKGTRPGALFRAYPGPWQVLRRNPLDAEDLAVVYTSEQRPSLKQVAMEILPNS